MAPTQISKGVSLGHQLRRQPRELLLQQHHWRADRAGPVRCRLRVSKPANDLPRRQQPRKDHADLTETTRDWKSSLQEWVQARGHTLPRYRLSGQSGPDHQKEFSIEVLLDNGVVGRGEGLSKKEAEQQAARSAFREVDGKKKNH